MDEGHGLSHSLDLIQKAFEIFDESDIDIQRSTIALAAVFHDFSYGRDYNSKEKEYHELVSSWMARKCMVQVCKNVNTEIVINMVANHTDGKNLGTLEARVFYLLDKLMDLDLRHTILSRDKRAIYNKRISFEDRMKFLRKGLYNRPTEMDKLCFVTRMLFDRNLNFNKQVWVEDQIVSQFNHPL